MSSFGNDPLDSDEVHLRQFGETVVDVDLEEAPFSHVSSPRANGGAGSSASTPSVSKISRSLSRSGLARSVTSEKLAAVGQNIGNLVGRIAHSETISEINQIMAERKERKRQVAEGRERLEVTKLKLKQANFESLDYQTIYNQKYRTELYTSFQNVTSDPEWVKWVISFACGIIIGLIAFTAKFAVERIQDFKFESVQEVLESKGAAAAYFLYLAFNIFIVGIGSLVAVYFEPTAAGSGIPEVKGCLNGTKIPHFLRLRTLWAKIVSMVCAVAGNLQVGAEGPFIHIGAIVANGLSQGQSKELNFKLPFRTFRNDRDKRDFISSGAGAGIASAFGAPMGGALFSLEEVSSFWSNALTWRTFFMCMIATYTMKLMLTIQTQDFRDNGFVIFNIGNTNEGYQLPEILPFLICGLLGGVLGALFTKINVAVSIMRRDKINKKKLWRVLEVLAIAALCSTVQFCFPFAWGCRDIADAGGRETLLHRHHCEEGQYNEFASLYWTSNEKAISNLLSFHAPDRFSYAAPLVHFFMYFIFASYTAGAGIASGLFVPMIVIGSAYGRVIGLMMTHMFPDSNLDPAAYALMGCAGFMGGLSRMTLSLTVILVECTGDLQFLLPMMLTIMTAKWTADSFCHPLFDLLMIDVKYIPYLEPHPCKESKLLMCKHIMNKPIKYLCEQDTVRNIIHVLKTCKHNGFPVVDNHEQKTFRGLLLRTQIILLLQEKAGETYNHELYQNKLAWKLPDVKDLKFEESELDVVVDLTDYMNITTVVVREDFAVSEAFFIFRTMGLRHMPVVNTYNCVRGMITKKDLVDQVLVEKYKALNFLKKYDIDINGSKDDEDQTPLSPSLSPKAPHHH